MSNSMGGERLDRKEAKTVIAEFISTVRRKGLAETVLLDMDISDDAFDEAVERVLGCKA